MAERYWNPGYSLDEGRFQQRTRDDRDWRDMDRGPFGQEYRNEPFRGGRFGHDYDRPYEGRYEGRYGSREHENFGDRGGWGMGDRNYNERYGMGGGFGGGGYMGERGNYGMGERGGFGGGGYMGERGNYGERFGHGERGYGDRNYGERSFGERFGFGGDRGDRGIGERVRSAIGMENKSTPKGYKRPDERILDDVCYRLWSNPEIDARDIEVEVKDGRVTLKGLVDERWMKRLAEDIVEDVFGVEDVGNELRVRGSLSEKVLGDTRDKPAEQGAVSRSAATVGGTGSTSSTMGTGGTTRR